MTLKQDAAIVAAEGGMSQAKALAFVRQARYLGAQLHAIYERQCNGHQTWDGRWDEAAAKRDDEREERYTRKARQLFDSHGLGLYLNTDPRGNPLGVLTPKTGRYNTLGGHECGWRL